MDGMTSMRWLSRLGAAALLAAGVASAADVHVMISAGFYEVYSELSPAFERASGHHLVTTRGPSMGDSPEAIPARLARRSEEHTSELQSLTNLVCRLLLEKKK